MKKAYFFPPSPKGGYPNPYCQHFKKALESHFILLDKDNKECKVAAWGLLRHAWSADIYILNWLENIAFHRFGWLQYVISLLALYVIILRRKKIVWVFHNITPHQGHDNYTRKFYRLLFRHANLIVAHSKEAKLYASKVARGKVLYECHPIVPFEVCSVPTNQYDLLIWGTIDPYKGVVEFISSHEVRASGLRVMIIGKCKDANLEDRINSLTNEHIHFENRRVSFDEIASLVKNSRYVVFPYVGESISSSGVLIDTIVLGGVPIGPNKGAFRDLSEEGVCLIYKDYSDLIKMVHQEVTIDEKQRSVFLSNHSWEQFTNHISQLLES